MRILSIIIGGAMLATAGPAAAQLRPLVDPPASAAAARDGVEVFLLNEGPAAVPAEGPAEIETVAKDGTRLRLVAAPDEVLTVAPGGFARLRYRIAAAAPGQVAANDPPAPVAPGPPAETVASNSARSSSGFLDRFHPYEPVYGAAGLGDAGAKLQVSFDFRLFGHDDGPRLDFAYTQTMFWALDQSSGPFRATNYSPELFVDMPVDATTTLGAGYRHDSNGERTARSIDVNRLFARATKSFDFGGDWRFDITPQAWFYVADQGVAPDLDRYWGYTSLSAAIGQRNGLKLELQGRGNPGTGKGSAEAFLSFPLARISNGLPHVYLFGQAFTGYGEALSDYNRSASHVRLGVAFTR
jgi:outer membrane phospholipase A